MTKSMTSPTTHRHNVGRRRYHYAHSGASQVFSVLGTDVLHSPKIRKLTVDRVSYGPGFHAGLTTVSTPYKASRVLWLEGDVTQSGPSSFADLPGESWKQHVERRAPRSTKEELVAVLRQYVGSWVAIRGSEVIVSNSSPGAVVSFLREHNLRADSILRVPREPMQEVGEIRLDS